MVGGVCLFSWDAGRVLGEDSGLLFFPEMSGGSSFSGQGSQHRLGICGALHEGCGNLQITGQR